MRSSSRLRSIQVLGCARFRSKSRITRRPCLRQPTTSRSPRPAPSQASAAPPQHRKSSTSPSAPSRRRALGSSHSRPTVWRPRRARSALQWELAAVVWPERETSVSPDSTRTVGARWGSRRSSLRVPCLLARSGRRCASAPRRARCARRHPASRFRQRQLLVARAHLGRCRAAGGYAALIFGSGSTSGYPFSPKLLLDNVAPAVP